MNDKVEGQRFNGSLAAFIFTKLTLGCRQANRPSCASCGHRL